MAFIIKDRVKEITTSTGTGAISLGGASSTFDQFQTYMSNGDTTYYAIASEESGVDEWEVGIGTWNTGNTLTRTTILAGSNSTSAVNFTAGDKQVFMTYPAAKAAFFNADGDLDLTRDPQTALQAATKQYVDTIAAAGLHYHAPVRVEHPSNLTATYNNGSSGVGATLTNSGTNAALVLDNVSMVLNDRVLVANQTDQTQNGVYTVTTVGDGSTAWVLTRSTDTDTAGPSDPDAFGKGDAFFIKEGDTNAGHLDVLTTTGTIVFGTTNIVFSEVAETTVYSAGDGLTLTGTEFSVGAGTGVTVGSNSVSIGQAVSTSDTPTFAGLTSTANISLGDDDKVLLGASNDLEIYHEGATGDSHIVNNGSGDLKVSSNITFGDNDKAIFGAGSDLQIYHDGSNSYVSDIGTGALHLRSTGGGVKVVDNNNAVKFTVAVGTGDVSVTGTVDGRDIAADGSKLDGIETGATADQTKADIDALGIDAATLDSLDSTQFLRSDANDTTSGILTSTNSDTVSGGITVDTNSHAYMSTDRGGTTVQAGYMWKTAGSADWYNYISTSSAELKWYTTSNVMTLTTSGSLSTTPQGTLWGSSNDGSGSGLDADTVDGIQGASFLRSDADDTTTGKLTISGSGTIGGSTISNGYLQITDGSATLAFDGNEIVGSASTYIRSVTGTTLTLGTGTDAQITISSTGVRIGDTGNGYFRPVSGNYGSIEIDAGGHGGYEGYGIGGVAVFMTNSTTVAGLYNDANNHWWMRGTFNGTTEIHYQGTSKLQTTSTGVNVTGALTATTKSFVIDHPTKEGMKLRYGSLEGPEDGVYVRGRLTGETVIELPDYWTGLVHEDSITVQLTAMGGKADLWVESIADNKVTVGCDTEVDCFYFVQATRKDVDAWDVEYVADS